VRDRERIDCLIVDDEVALSEATVEYFTMLGVSAAHARDSASALTFLAAHDVGVILLDINLDGESGFELCRRLRRDTDCPILFISVRGGDDDVLLALGVGGDDHIRKPYSLSVLLAKVQAVLRRADAGHRGDGPGDRFAFGPFQVRFDLERVYGPDGEVPLTALEYRLLAHLIGARGRTVPKRELFQAVWGHTAVGDGTLNVHMRRLRAKLGGAGGGPERWLKTAWGVGYFFADDGGMP
jgi:two-component system response regulator RegX3